MKKRLKNTHKLGHWYFWKQSEKHQLGKDCFQGQKIAIVFSWTEHNLHKGIYCDEVCRWSSGVHRYVCPSGANCIQHFHWMIQLFWLIKFDVTIVSIGNNCNIKPDWPESPFGTIVKVKPKWTESPGKLRKSFIQFGAVVCQYFCQSLSPPVLLGQACFIIMVVLKTLKIFSKTTLF